jgi:beta-lactamase regulating signal transducer with metallopeptidase domain
MLHQIFYWVLNMSILASVFGILIYTLRYIKGFPKLASYVLWAVILVRMLCPVGISSEYSLLNLISNASEWQIVRTIPLEGPKDTGSALTQRMPQLSLSNTIQEADSYHPVVYKSNMFADFIKVASVVWIIVLTAEVIAIIFLYCLTQTELKKAVHLRGIVYEGDMVNAPAVFGIIKPKLILPTGMKKEHLRYILAHEKVHIRRHDNLWRMLAILAACIHWFNPLSWLFLRCFLKDCELACDETAIKMMNQEERKKYAMALLSCACDDITVFSSSFGSSKVKVRITNVLSYRRLTLFSAVCFILMVLTAAYLVLTNAAR